MIRFVVPVALIIMVVVTIVTLAQEGYEGYPTWFLYSYGIGTVVFALGLAALLTLLRWRVNVDDFEPDAADELSKEVKG